ncbi:MAG: hypothetical protein ABSB42_03995 [Tepidisphaeraceae bacterium]|jgi:predicted RNA-binding Zn-ribbon protein involved in translation (DUF1610 family)
MARFGRGPFNGIAALSLVVSIGAMALWARGRSVNDEIYFNLHSHLIIAGSFPNHFDLIYYRAANYRGRLIEVFPHDKRVPLMPEFWTFRIVGNAFRWEVAVPWWLFLIVGLAMPAMAASRAAKRRRDVRQGRCVSCGYDLRATPDRCPECGSIPPKREIIRKS